MGKVEAGAPGLAESGGAAGACARARGPASPPSALLLPCAQRSWAVCGRRLALL